MIRIQMGEHNGIQVADSLTVELIGDICRGIDQQVLVVQEKGWPSPPKRIAFFPGLPADPALAEGPGDRHTPS
jgi:hypothetical protein